VSWLLAIALAGAAFAIAAFVLRVSRQMWTTLAAALAVGLAGYALQASPDLPGAPASPDPTKRAPGEAFKQARRAMFASDDRSHSPMLLTADAFAARGQTANAAALLSTAVEQEPDDAEAWLALANVLVEHAEGRLTDPALFAYRRAAEADPGSIGPGYFLGFALLRQGSLGEGREVWAATLERARADAVGRGLLEERLTQLDVLLRQAAGPAAP
jgi:cytochrome c-type biogenesis protein CcmH